MSYSCRWSADDDADDDAWHVAVAANDTFLYKAISKLWINFFVGSLVFEKKISFLHPTADRPTSTSFFLLQFKRLIFFLYVMSDYYTRYMYALALSILGTWSTFFSNTTRCTLWSFFSKLFTGFCRKLFSKQSQ